MTSFSWNAYNLGEGQTSKPTNRTCPNCGQDAFVCIRSLQLADGSVWRERRCRSCGHIEERLQPPEKRLSAAEIDNEVTVTQDE